MVLDAGVKAGMKLLQKCKNILNNFSLKVLIQMELSQGPTNFPNSWNQFNSNENSYVTLGYLSVSSCTFLLHFCGDKYINFYIKHAVL